MCIPSPSHLVAFPEEAGGADTEWNRKRVNSVVEQHREQVTLCARVW